jgi:hypothetical protein
VEHGTGVRTRRCPDPSPPRWQPPVAAPGQIGQILVAAFSGGRAGLLPGDATAPAVPGG